MFGISWLTKAQISGGIQRIIIAGGAFLAANPWAAESKWGQIAGAALVLGGLLFGVKTNTVPALVAKVDAIAKDPTSPVQGIIMAPTTEGIAIANDLRSPTTAPAETVQALKLAKAA